jgi:hypothetical protein
VDRWGFEGSRVYATAINALTLEVYYRYANVFNPKRIRTTIPGRRTSGHPRRAPSFFLAGASPPVKAPRESSYIGRQGLRRSSMKNTAVPRGRGMLAVVGCDKSDQKSVKDMAPKSTDLGTGLNAVEKSYARPAGEMSDVVAGVLQSFDLKLESTTHDDLGGEIVARRADGHKVTAKITARDEAACDVSIRVGPEAIARWPT